MNYQHFDININYYYKCCIKWGWLRLGYKDQVISVQNRIALIMKGRSCLPLPITAHISLLWCSSQVYSLINILHTKLHAKFTFWRIQTVTHPLKSGTAISKDCINVKVESWQNQYNIHTPLLSECRGDRAFPWPLKSCSRS